MKTMKLWIWGALVSSLACLGSMATVLHAQEAGTSPSSGGACVSIGKGGGNEIPTPFNTYNQKLELADHELYVLVGRVVFAPHFDPSEKLPQAYLEVDLNEHAWLANAKRKQSPLYPLEGTSDFWKKYEGTEVKLTCEALGHVVSYEKDGHLVHEYVISLRPLTENGQPKLR